MRQYSLKKQPIRVLGLPFFVSSYLFQPLLVVLLLLVSSLAGYSHPLLSIQLALSTPWKNSDIGTVGIAGSANYSNGTYTVKGAGKDFWIAPDNFHYVYQPIVGNTTLTARVATFQNTSPNGKSGIMIRETLSPSASFVATVVNTTGSLFMTRTGTLKPTYVGRSGAAPKWVRLVRSGNTFTSSYSADGKTWSTISTVTLTMSATVYVGLCVTSNNTALFATSTFTNVTVSGQAPTPLQQPSVTSTIPASGSVGVSVNSSISTSILNLPNGGINNATITSSTVRLLVASTSLLVAGTVNGTGGRDGITFVPNTALKPSTLYRFEITSGVKDLAGVSFKAFSSTFTTGLAPVTTSSIAKFKKVALPNAADRYSSLQIGPDGKLYALTIDGRIKRFFIRTDGTLDAPEEILSLQNYAGGQRLSIGLAFGPTSTASNLICYITHHSFVFEAGPLWDGKLARLSGATLEKVENIIINLPRSTKDHLNQSLAFGPDGALYFPVGSNSAMGRADATWGGRNENLLSGAVLRLDLKKLSTLPLDVKTPEASGGVYNPYDSLAPLTIYATGIRNAFDLLWHSNGELYLPTNGSNPGGNTPASVAGTKRIDGSLYSGPLVPALSSVPQTMFDYLFRIQKGGYYGHPNPRRGEYVLYGGNPTSGVDPTEVTLYPVGTLPDANYRGFAYDFANNKSPNGVIEYKSNTFNGALKGKLLVVRFSQKNDIMVLEPGADKNIAKAIEGIAIPGFSGFSDPLDLIEDPKTGNIYVVEYNQLGTAPKLTLLVPDLTSTAIARQGYSLEDEQANPEIYDGAGVLSFRKEPFQNLTMGNGLRLYPNPATDRVMVEYTSLGKESPVQLQIYNGVGMLITEQLLSQSDLPGRQALIEVSRLQKGRYLLVLTDGSSRSSASFIKL